MTVLVNNPPTAVNDAVTTAEETLITIDPLIANGKFGNPDSDVDGDVLTVFRAVEFPANGGITINGKMASVDLNKTYIASFFTYISFLFLPM